MFKNLWSNVVGNTVWKKNIRNANMQAQVYLWKRGEDYSVWFRSSRYYSVRFGASWVGAGFRAEAIPHLIEGLKEAEAEWHRLTKLQLGRQN